MGKIYATNYEKIKNSFNLNTGLELYYEGSVTIDLDILKKADILPNEQIQVVNINNVNDL